MCSQSVASCLDARFRWISIYEYRTHTHFNFMRWSNTVTRRSHPNTCQPDNTNRKLILILTHTTSHTHTYLSRNFLKIAKLNTHTYSLLSTLWTCPIYVYIRCHAQTHTHFTKCINACQQCQNDAIAPLAFRCKFFFHQVTRLSTI